MNYILAVSLNIRITETYHWKHRVIASRCVKRYVHGLPAVYFELITDDIDAFFPGTIIPIQIKASATTPGFKARDINLNGKGSVVRNDIRDGNRLGVALEFKEKLDLLME